MAKVQTEYVRLGNSMAEKHRRCGSLSTCCPSTLELLMQRDRPVAVLHADYNDLRLTATVSCVLPVEVLRDVKSKWAFAIGAMPKREFEHASPRIFFQAFKQFAVSNNAYSTQFAEPRFSAFKIF
jgi:hypothetical protein